MENIYLVKHLYDVDGEFGDAVQTESTIAVFATREEADEFVRRYSKPHIYDKPYNCLERGYLEVEMMKVNTLSEFTATTPEEFWGENCDDAYDTDWE